MTTTEKSDQNSGSGIDGDRQSSWLAARSDSNYHYRHKRKRDTSLDTEHRRPGCGNRYSNSFEGEHRHKHDNSSGDEYRRSRHRHKHHRSSDDEYHHQNMRLGRGAELEEGETYAKSDQSKLSEGNVASREASVDISNPDAAEGMASSMPSAFTTISNDLRAKIRAMLMATLYQALTALHVILLL
ncbi:uncharacterized protein LOC120126215 [Hibiscus syriacus]|uniref:uncharacterized protein LOC120126215 n=1 Tax=Hibiscus syriacus TaxID=106335 RepID=UPI00192062E9|nr:uncharacterized protein LOC120126215 [Hibiscus syriacus]